MLEVWGTREFRMRHIWNLLALVGSIWVAWINENLLRVGLDCAFGVWFLRFFFFFFFLHAFVRLWLLFMYCSMNSSRKVWLFYFFSQSVHIVHCSWTHKFHFSATFSLKMGRTVLFTHLKIILLQYFSVFSFSFQFSAVSKRTLRGRSFWVIKISLKCSRRWRKTPQA